MKKTLLSFFAILAFASFVNAQVPAKVGWWKFDDAANMVKAQIGSPLVLTGTQTSVPGPVVGNLATQVPKASYLTMTHGIAPNGGGDSVNEYTIQIDFSVPAIGAWHSFIQTNPSNSGGGSLGDAELFTNTSNHIGTATTGYSINTIAADTWYRMVISVKNGEFFRVYLNGDLWLEKTLLPVDGRWALVNELLLFADDDGDDGTINCSEIGMWDVALTNSQVSELGNASTVTVPASVGSWKFDDAADMLKADIGLPLELNGTQVSVPGPVSGNLATQIGPGSNLKLTHGIAPNGGGTKVNNYTIMMDVSLPALGVWHAFYQTEVANTGDADLFCRAVESTLGVGDLGYGSKALLQDIWYRMVISVENGTSYNVYLNTELFLKGKVQPKDGRFALADALLLFADNSGDDNLINCAEVAMWNFALSEAEITELGFAPGTVLVSGITVTGEGDATTITTDNGTLQLNAAILPVDATIQSFTWSVTKGTGSASISSTGLLTARENGTVTVMATANDPGHVTASKEITISNQSLTIDDFNLIKDGGFATDGLILPTGGAWESWTDNGGTATVTAGECVLVPGAVAANYKLQLNQVGNTNGWSVANDETYVLMFDAKADAPRSFTVDFEDPNNGYRKFGVSSAPDSQKGLSEWLVAVTTDMTTYSRDVTFNAVLPNTKFVLKIMPSAAIEPVHIDNVYLINATDIPKFGTLVTDVTVKSAADATTIDTDKGTLQMMVDFLPVNATLQGVFWTVTNGTGSATISNGGLLSAKLDGTVTVVATSKDGSGIVGTKEITISNQLESRKVGWWKFDDAADMLKAEVGLPLELNGTQVSVPGLTAGNLATQIGVGSNLKITHGIAPNLGGTKVNEYTLMLDFSVPVASVWHAFYQTTAANTGDAELFKRNNNSTIGVGATGYSTKTITENIWYRMVITVKNGEFYKVYCNTELYVNSAAIQPIDGRFSLESALLLFADDSGDDNLINCSEAAIWDVALTEAQVLELGLAPGTVLVTGITVTGEASATTITTDNGTLQMNAAVAPATATNKAVKWSVVNGTGSASISSTGLLTAREDGTVTVTAAAMDISGKSGSKVVTISNQVLTMEDFNIIKDGGFATDGAIASPWNFWSGNGGTASVVSGVCVMVPGPASDTWQLQVNQAGNDVGWSVANGESYVFMFDAKADSARYFNIDFEDPTNGYKRFGLSSAADAIKGESEWKVALTADMTTYTRDVTFNEVKSNTRFLLNILPGAAIKPVHIDNIMLIKATDISKFGVLVTGLTVKGEGDVTTIETAGGTLQMFAEVLPLDATLQGVTWSVVNGTGEATISSQGLLTAVLDGTVTVTATAKDGSGISASMEVTIDQTVGISDKSANAVKIYPNPAQNNLYISGKPTLSKVVIYNVLGTQVKEYRNVLQSINVSDLKTGVYIIKLTDTYGKTVTSKFIKK